MQQRFGFIASEKLVGLIKEANVRLGKGEDKKDPMYPYRNRLIEQVSEELVDSFILQQAQKITNTERKESLIKLGKTLQAIINKVVKVMLSKDKDAIVMQSQAFLDDTVGIDAEGRVRVGAAVPADFYQKIMANFDAIERGEHNPDVVKAIQECLKTFDDIVLSHFILDFVKTLGWGMVKMNLAKATKAAITKADNVMIDQMLPKLKLSELQEVAPHLHHFFYETDKVGASFVK